MSELEEVGINERHERHEGKETNEIRTSILEFDFFYLKRNYSSFLQLRKNWKVIFQCKTQHPSNSNFN